MFYLRVQRFGFALSTLVAEVKNEVSVPPADEFRCVLFLFHSNWRAVLWREPFYFSRMLACVTGLPFFFFFFGLHFTAKTAANQFFLTSSEPSFRLFKAQAVTKNKQKKNLFFSSSQVRGHFTAISAERPSPRRETCSATSNCTPERSLSNAPCAAMPAVGVTP